MCMVLPSVIDRVVKQENTNRVSHDTVVEELANIAISLHMESKEVAMAMAVYMLGFNSL